MLKRRQEDIRAKGFSIVDREEEYNDEIEFDENRDYSKLRVGMRKIDNPIINLGTYRKAHPNFGNKQFVLHAIYTHNYELIREISNFFYETSGIYNGLCRYASHLYRYDWYVVPYLEDKTNQNKVLKDFANVLSYLDNSNIKLSCDDIALAIIKDGAYYGMVVDFNDRVAFQSLPAKYCRCRYYSGDLPIVELNLQFFDAYFTNLQYKVKILKTFPKEIQLAYVKYKQGKLKGDNPHDKTCWYPFEPGAAIKLSLSDNDMPLFISTIPSIIDLDLAQDLDRKKTMQQLLKIIIQKLPLDKNGDLIFDVDEAKDIHNNAVAMLKRAIGVDVLTTFADIDKIDTKDSNSQTSKDDLEKVERTVYNSATVSRNLFNADGNLATTNSILADEASLRTLPFLFQKLFNQIVRKFGKKNCSFRFFMLETTQFNYQALSKLYKEQAQMGYDKLLPQVALGICQSNILATMHFQNEILNLAEIMIAPATSNTTSAADIQNKNKNKQGSTEQTTTTTKTETKEAGRPEKEDSEKSDKTIANQEAQS